MPNMTKSDGQLRRSLTAKLLFCLIFTGLFMSSVNLVEADQAKADAHLTLTELPFWPSFPASLKVKPTSIYMQHQAGIDAGVKVRGEGPGFVMIAKSDKSMIFATPPRLAPAWHVECELISCDLKRVASEEVTSIPATDESRGRAAYQAALTFVALYTGFNENMTSRQIENTDLPAISRFKSSSSAPQKSDSRSLRSKSLPPKTLLQGFQ